MSGSGLCEHLQSRSPKCLLYTLPIGGLEYSHLARNIGHLADTDRKLNKGHSMSHKARQLTNSFFSGPYDQTPILNELKSDTPSNGTPRVFQWANPNPWNDLNSGRNAIQVEAGMTLKVTVEGDYILKFDVIPLVQSALLVYKFDAYDNTNTKLFTIVTRRQSIVPKKLLIAGRVKVRGIVEEIDNQSDLNEIVYFVRRGAGQYRD
jgi:hypothetical protein